MSTDNSAEYTIEIDLDSYLCNLDNIQEITFEFINPTLQNDVSIIDETNERIIDINLNDIRKEDENIKEISAEINGEDTIIKTSNVHDHQNEIDILQMDENELIETPQKLVNQIEDQVSLETQIEI